MDAADHVAVRLGTWTTGPDGRVAVARRKFGRVGSAILRLLRISPDLTVRMDTLSSTAWRLMDGRTVAEVLEGLKAAFPAEEDLDLRLGRFLSTMARHRLVRLEPRSSSR